MPARPPDVLGTHPLQTTNRALWRRLSSDVGTVWGAVLFVGIYGYKDLPDEPQCMYIVGEKTDLATLEN